MSRSPGWIPVAGFCLLLAVFAFRLLDTAEDKTLTADEPLYVGPGLVLWDTGKYDFAANLSLHPPLVFHIAAVPLLAFDLDDLPREPGIVRRIFEREEPSTRAIRMATRLPFIALACWGAFLCFSWAREVAGGTAGLLAAFLYTFAPSVLANGGLIHSDITVTIFFLQTLYTQWRWLVRPSTPRLVVCGLSLGLALISKLSALLLLASVGVLFLAVALRLRSERPTLPFVGPEALGPRIVWALSAGLAAFAVALGVLWLGYGGSFRIVTLDVGPWAGVALPGYLLALVFDRAINSGGRDLYLLGEIASGGWWYYFPVAFAAKVPLAISALFGLALAAPAVRPARLGWWLAVPSAIYLAIAMFWLDITLGLRYLLPLFPLLYVFIATQLVPLGTGRRRGVVAGLCGWLAVTSLWIHPHYLAYFNEAVGGPARGHGVLLESNIDWGQDLGTLADFLAERGNPPVWLAYLGPEKPADHGIHSRPLTGCSPVIGLVAISLNVREGLYHAQGGFGQRPKNGCYDWLDEYEPIATPGYSIVVYDVPAKAAPAP